MSATFWCKLFLCTAIFGYVTCVNADYVPVKYFGHLSAIRVDELNNMGRQIELSVNPDKYACDAYFDYVCSRYRPIYSVMGSLPNTTEIIHLMTELQADRENFEAKQKLNDFFVSCNTIRHVEDCYRETFTLFKPIFAYVIAKYHIDSSSHEHRTFLDILEKFLRKAERTENFVHSEIPRQLMALKDKFARPQLFFRIADLNQEYKELRIYRESYEHNLRNLEKHRRRQTTYELGERRVMLDWTFYVYQSRNKPRSYFYPTLNVHLWMTMYNRTVREYEPKRLQSMAECLTLPQYISVLEEARILAVVYLKSFRRAWEEYVEWIQTPGINLEIHDQENTILRKHSLLNNNALFFVLYAQNFCDFGKELAEHVFYLGFKESVDFDHFYHCHRSQQPRDECVP